MFYDQQENCLKSKTRYQNGFQNMVVFTGFEPANSRKSYQNTLKHSISAA
jgi:hypothetical protein